MTFTVLGRCAESGRVGVGIATYSLAGGAYCPFFARGKAVLSTQAFANPALGPLALEAIDQGVASEEILQRLAAADDGFDFRQVSILPLRGVPAMHTGSRCRTWAGHEVGDGFAAFGNVLAGQSVVAAMASAYRESAGEDLGGRLLRALEAGRDAGGQASAEGLHLAERSGAIAIRGPDITEDIDLRVDLSEDAVTELREIYAQYVPYVAYYKLRAQDPANTPAQDVWARENLGGA